MKDVRRQFRREPFLRFSHSRPVSTIEAGLEWLTGMVLKYGSRLATRDGDAGTDARQVSRG
jgi:hypothetical protein